MKKIGFMLETLAGLLFIWIVNVVLFRDNPGFLGIAPHPYLYLVVLITLRYGYIRGIFSLLAAGLSYLLCLYPAGMLGEFAFWGPLATYFIFLTITGLLADNYRNKLKKADEHIHSLTRVSEQLTDEKDKFELQNQELSQQLMAEKSTFSILYRAARKISTLDADKLLAGIIDVLDNIIGADNCAVFFLAGHKLKLRAARDLTRVHQENLDQELIEQVIKEKKTFSIKDVLARKGNSSTEVFLLGPLLNGSGGEPVGIILVQGLDFLKYNPTTVRIFTLLCDWISICYYNAQLYQARGPAEDWEQLLTGARAEFKGIFEYGIESSRIAAYVDKVCQNL